MMKSLNNPVLNIINVLILFILTGCAYSGSEKKASGEMAIRAGQQIAAESFNELSGHLGAALEKGGVSHAIQFCSAEAIPVTRQLSDRFGVDIKRATHKPRNPANEATGRESDIISDWLTRMENRDEIKPMPVSSGDSLYVYAPILISNQLCLNCHGSVDSDIEPGNLELIRSVYEDDKAVNFEMGDLRGMWSIRMPADSATVADIIEMTK